MRYRLRTLLILLAIMPPLLWLGWTKYQAWRAAQELRRALEVQQVQEDTIDLIVDVLDPVLQPPQDSVIPEPKQPQPAGDGAK